MEKIGDAPNPRFKIGDKITYKPRSGGYYFGGNEQGEYKGTIKGYEKYRVCEGCFEILVTTKNMDSYLMLESEFVEWDTPQPIDNYQIY
jgi:hypothetical protein